MAWSCRPVATAEQWRFLKRIAKGGFYRPNQRVAVELRTLGWPIQVDRPLDPECASLAVIEKAHQEDFQTGYMAEAARQAALAEARRQEKAKGAK
jgi:hypothetical protein